MPTVLPRRRRVGSKNVVRQYRVQYLSGGQRLALTFVVLVREEEYALGQTEPAVGRTAAAGRDGHPG